ncbi:MAG: hypothetical protein HQ528_03580, partial [Candidatus Marinimicrobia bacterium]|nr:hypothetical protein [Candidatus Neomarinimicrobiota bacterium]
TGYRIDVYGKTEYEKQQNEQNTMLADVPDFPDGIAEILAANNIKTITDALNTDEENLLAIEGITSDIIDLVYNSIQSFIERSDNDDSEEPIDGGEADNPTDSPQETTEQE